MIDDAPPDFEVTFTATPAAAGKATDDTARLASAADGQPPIPVQLKIDVAATDDRSELASAGSAMLKVDLKGLVTADATGAVAVVAADVAWDLAPLAGRPAVWTLTSHEPIAAARTSVTLGPLIVAGDNPPRQPVVSLGGWPSTKQNSVAIDKRPPPGQLQDLGAKVQWAPGSEHPILIGDPRAVDPSPPVLLITAPPLAGKGGTVTLWFDVVDDGTPPRQTSLGQRSEASTFVFSVTSGYVAWTPVPDDGSTAGPKWAFTAGSGGTLLPKGQARIRIVGSLSPGAPDMPNLPGATLLFVQIDVDGYQRHLSTLMLTKSRPIDSVTVETAEKLQVFPQASGDYLVGLPPGASPTVDVTVGVAVDEASVDTVILTLPDNSSLPSPSLRYVKDSDPELVAGSIHLGTVTLAETPKYEVDARKGSTLIGTRSLTLQPLSLVPGADLTGVNLTGLVGDHLDLTGAVLTKAHLTRARLGQAALHKATLKQAVLRNAVLTGADLSGADLTGADLTSADLTGADLRGATLDGATLTGALFPGVKMGHCQGLASVIGLDPAAQLGLLNDLMSTPPLTPAERAALGRPFLGENRRYLQNADLRGAYLAGANLSTVYFQGAKLGGADLTGASLRAAFLADADLAGAHLEGADLAQAKWNRTTGLDTATGVDRRTMLTWLLVNRSQLLSEGKAVNVSDVRSVGLDRSCLGGANLDGVDLSQTSLVYADLNNATVDGCDLSFATLCWAWLMAVDTTKAKSFEGTQLWGVDWQFTGKSGTGDPMPAAAQYDPPPPGFGAPDETPMPPDGTFLAKAGPPRQVWVTYGGAGFRVPDDTLGTLYGYPQTTPVQDWDAPLSAIPADGTMLRENPSGRIWVVFGGARFWVPSQDVLVAWYGDKPQGQVWDGALDQIGQVPADGTLLRENPSGTLSVVYGGAAFQIPSDVMQKAYAVNSSGLNPWGAWGELWDGALQAAGVGTVPADGTLLRGFPSVNRVYVINGGHKTWAQLKQGDKPGLLWDEALDAIPDAPAG